MRLKHPNMRSVDPVRITFDGTEIEALPGETVAAALAAADIVAVRETRSHAPRGPFCGMGVCFACLVTIDGRPPGTAHGVDVDDKGNGTVVEQRLYQLIRQPGPIADRQFEIEFLDSGLQAFDFTFG